jgi:hypothetical protein
MNTVKGGYLLDYVLPAGTAFSDRTDAARLLAILA